MVGMVVGYQEDDGERLVVGNHAFKVVVGVFIVVKNEIGRRGGNYESAVVEISDFYHNAILGLGLTIGL